MYIRSTVSASTNSVMLIEPVPFSSSALSSSGVNWTYRPVANSYPLIMSSFSTFSPSFEQTYCCFRRAPSFLCSQLNEIAADDSPAENILIGTETSPKEIVAEPIECAGIGPAGDRGERPTDRVRILPLARGRVHPAPAAPIATRCAFGLQWTTTVTPTPRRAQAIPRQALRRPHARAIGLCRRRARAAVHRPPTRRHPPPFRPAARAGRCVEIVGRAQVAVARSRRQTPGRACRGPPHRVWRRRGDHPRRQLR